MKIVARGAGADLTSAIAPTCPARQTPSVAIVPQSHTRRTPSHQVHFIAGAAAGMGATDASDGVPESPGDCGSIDPDVEWIAGGALSI